MRVIREIGPNSILLWACEEQLRKRINEKYIHRKLLCRTVTINEQFAYLLFYLSSTNNDDLSIPENIDTSGYTYQGCAELDKCKIGIFFLDEEPDFSESLHPHRDGMWVSAAEIVNSQHAFGVSINPDVTKLFELYPSIYSLYHRTSADTTKLDVPSAAYFGNSKERVALTLVMGLQRGGAAASEGPFYYSGSYERALRYACITSNKEPLKVDGHEVTYPGTSVYKEGALIRLYLLLGRTGLTSKFKQKQEESKPDSALINPDGAWVREYDSIIQTRTFDGERRLFPQYVVASSDQINLGGYIYIDTSKVTSISDYKKKAVPK